MTSSRLGARGQVVLASQLTAAMTAATLMQFLLAGLGPLLVESLELTSSGLGLLHTTYFATATAASLWVGGLSDRIGGRRLLRLMLGWQAATFVLMASWGTLFGVVVAALLAGIGTAAGNPATNAVAMAAMPHGRRGPLLGIKQSGPWVGAVVSGVILVPIAIQTSWRFAVAIVGAAIALLAIVPIPTRSDPHERTFSRARVRVRDLPRSIRWLIPYAFFLGLVGSGVSSYLTVFAVDSLGFSEARAGMALAVVGVSAVVARVLWGRIGDRWHWRQSPLRLIVIASIPFLILLAVADQQHLGPLLWVAAVGLGVSAMAWNSPGMLHITRAVDIQTAGRASGLVLTGFYAGLLSGPTIVGTTLQLTGSYWPAWLLLTAFAAAAFPTSNFEHGSTH